MLSIKCIQKIKFNHLNQLQQQQQQNLNMKNYTLKILTLIGLTIIYSFSQSFQNDIRQQLLTSALQTRPSSIPSNETRLLQTSLAKVSGQPLQTSSAEVSGQVVSSSKWNSTNGTSIQIYASTGTLKIGNLTALCNPGCAVCTSVDVCTKCGLGLFSNAGKCAKSSATGCRTAASLTTCSQCMDGFYLLSNNTCTKCAQTCLACSGSASSCLTCKKGNSLSLTSCVACISDCDDCTGNSSACITCRGGFTYNAQAAACVRCPVAGCAVCPTFSTCTKCAEGLQLTNGTCTPCPTGCAICVSGVCYACRSGLQLTTDKTCIKQCKYPCASCVKSPTNCTSCIAGYSFVGGSCVANLTCSQKSTCVACPIGYSLQQKKCVECNGGSNCQGCTVGNSSQCLTCVSGYFLKYNSSNTCSKCPTECEECIDEISCISCVDGYYLSGSSCQPCHFSCSTCFDTAKNCETCASKFTRQGSQCRLSIGVYFDITFNKSLSLFTFSDLSKFTSDLSNKTKLSSDSIVVTSIKSGTNIARLLQTQTNTVVVSGKADSQNLKETQALISNASVANSTLGGLPVVSSQVTVDSELNSIELTGTLIIGAQTALCNPGCAVCTSVDVCNKCGLGLFSNAGICAKSQVTGCRIAASLTTCSQCQDQYYLDSNRGCSKCTENCLTCSGIASFCRTCRTGNYLSGTSCVACISNCEVCINSIQCIQCSPGFNYVSQVASCVRCLIPGCSKCSTFQSCQKCSQGLQLFNNGTCTPCPDGCKKCSSGVCSECIQGLRLTIIKTCIPPCVKPCDTCVRSPTECTNCIAGYNFLGGRCIPIPVATCNNQSSCVACPIGYSLQSKNCVKCNGGPNCQGCVEGNSSQCVTCVKGYYIVVSSSSNTCSKCPNECTSCNDQISCTSCAEGYYLIGSSCQVCDPSCKTCSGTATKCLRCKVPWYTRRVDICISNIGVRFRFIFKKKSQQFQKVEQNELANRLSKMTRIPSQKIVFNSIKSAAPARLLQQTQSNRTQVIGIVNDPRNPSQIQQLISSAIKSGLLDGLGLQTFQVAVFNDIVSTNYDWVFYRNLAIIVGVVIPIVLIIFFIIFFIGYKKGAWLNEGHQQLSSKDSEYSTQRII